MSTYETTGAKPNEIINHMIEKDYVIVGLTPEDFVSKHTGIKFNLNDIKKEFNKHCVDYNQPLAAGTKNEAVEFCSKMIYEVGPETRKVKKGVAEKT